jgi:hypothetical protein
VCLLLFLFLCESGCVLGPRVCACVCVCVCVCRVVCVLPPESVRVHVCVEISSMSESGRVCACLGSRCVCRAVPVVGVFVRSRVFGVWVWVIGCPHG